MLSAYINSLVFWLYQVYINYTFIHCGGSEPFLLGESIQTLLERIDYHCYASEYTFAAWCRPRYNFA